MMTMTRKTPSTARTADASDAGPLRNRDATGTPWGAFRILLVADRVPSLRAGSTHKVYRGWRFAAVTQQGQPQPGTTVFTVPVDPMLLATSGSRYALKQLENQGGIAVGDAAAFSWATTTTGSADPFAAAQARAQRVAVDAGWMRDAEVPARYSKTDPTLPVGDEAAMPTPELTGHPAVSIGSTHRSLPESVHLLTATSPVQIAGLDEWETDGGASNPWLSRARPQTG